jgi:hypothetical protein
MNSYELSRNWFDWCFENPEKINTNHHAIYFFAIEHCNRLGWKEKFGFPSQMTMDAIGIKNYRTYIKAFNDLVEFGFIDLIKKSSNQYSANVIAIVKNTKATTKALDNAFTTHNTKQSQSSVSINKQPNNITNKQKNNIPDFDTFLNHALTKEPNIDEVELKKKYDAWINNDWHDGNGKKITIWKTKLNSTLPYIPKKKSKEEQDKNFYKITL